MDIEIKQMSFSYRDVVIFERANYSFREGNIYILLGRNGVGKTTLLNILTGSLRAKKGSIIYSSVFNNQKFGYMSDDFYYYPQFSLKEMCELIKELRELPELTYKQNYENYLKNLQLEDYENKKIDEFSLGTKQRSHLLITLLHDPEVIFLDEPTIGLDPEQIYNFKNIIYNLKEKGKLIILSTHSLGLANDLADELVVIAQRELVKLNKNGTLEADYLALQK